MIGAARPSDPISPTPLRDPLPHGPLAFIGNGHLGFRVGRVPIDGGYVHVNGFSDLDPDDGVPSLASAPYPLAGDLIVDGVAASSQPDALRFVGQRLDFATGELSTRFTVDVNDTRLAVDAITLCCRRHPALVLQQLTVRSDRACDVEIVAAIEPAGIPGTVVAAGEIPAGKPPTPDGFLMFEARAGGARCGFAITTAAGPEILARPPRVRRAANGRLEVGRPFHLASGQTASLRTIVGIVPDLAHARPERQAALLVARGMARGWDALRAANRAAWADLWLAHPLIDGPDPWQKLADASFYYLHSNVSPASLAGSGVFGLAPTPGYHGYGGRVMWDIESFALPPLVLTDPPAARALLRFRTRTAPAARRNAALHGYDGLQYPWEADFEQGDEAVPRWSMTDKDHVSLDIGLAFALYLTASGDLVFGRQEGLPVVTGIAEWLLSRIEWTARGAEIRGVRGPAEAFDLVDNDAFVNLAAITFLRRAAAVMRWLGDEPPTEWEAVADAIVVPRDPRTGAIINHEGYAPMEPLGETPEGAASFFPLGFRDGRISERATLRHALQHQAPAYVGTPMYSALLGVHAAWLGLRRQSADLFEHGYAAFFDDPFLAPDEYPAAKAQYPPASPMLANLGAFLASLLYGLPGILPTMDEPRGWPERPVILPAGWRSVEAERIWIRGRPTRLIARHGMDRARLLPASRPPQQARATRRRPPLGVTGRTTPLGPHTVPTAERTTSRPQATNAKY